MAKEYRIVCDNNNHASTAKGPWRSTKQGALSAHTNQFPTHNRVNYEERDSSNGGVGLGVSGSGGVGFGNIISSVSGAVGGAVSGAANTIAQNIVDPPWSSNSASVSVITSQSDSSYDRAEQNRFGTIAQTQKTGSTTQSDSSYDRAEQNRFGTIAQTQKVDTRTKEEKSAEITAKYNAAIEKAIAGDPTDMKNLDKSLTGAERPPIGYTPEYLQLEKRAKAAGVSIDQQKANETALATSSTKLIRGDGAFSPDDGGANTGNGAAVFAVNAKGEKFHVTFEAAEEMKKNGTWTEPVVVSQSVVDAMTFGKRLVSAADLGTINATPAPPDPVVATSTPPPPEPPPEPAEQPGDVIEPEQEAGESDGSDDNTEPETPEEEAVEEAAEGEGQTDETETDSSTNETDDESLPKAKGGGGPDADEEDEEKQSALATRRSKDEERLKKILNQREKWGGASAGSGSEALAAPVITPASNSQGFGGIPGGR
jgi:hypothetical protein